MNTKNILLTILIGMIAGFSGGLIAVRFNSPPVTPSNSSSGPSSIMQIEGTVSQGKTEACSSEIEKFCKITKPDEGGQIGCLLDVYEQSSKKCRDSLEVYANRWKICDAEVKQFCPGTKLGKMRIPKCLKLHAKKLSSECAQELYK